MLYNYWLSTWREPLDFYMVIMNLQPNKLSFPLCQYLSSNAAQHAIDEGKISWSNLIKWQVILIVFFFRLFTNFQVNIKTAHGYVNFSLGLIIHWVFPNYFSKGVNKTVQFIIFACLKIATFCFYVWSNLASYKMVQDYFICRALFDALPKSLRVFSLPLN